MPHFIECSVPSIAYLRGETVTNSPVNLDLCKQIRRTKLAWYPDNGGRPAIRFEGCDAEWAYNTEAEREADFARIIATRS